VTETPVISVVVATHNRADRLAGLVAALEAQGCREPFEIVIIDDASADTTWSVLEELAANSRVPLRPVRIRSNSGPARARNAGWSGSAAAIIAFTDDDCIPGRDWLSQLLAGFADADIVVGSTIPAEHDEPDGASIRTMSITSETGLYETCNIAFRRDLLERLGGFDEAFRYPYGEDADLGWRARAIGARTVFRSTAIVEHEVTRPSMKRRVDDLKRLDGVALLLKRHPGVRVYFYRRVFYRRSHLLALLALAGVGLMLRRPGAPFQLLGGAALATPWVFNLSSAGGIVPTRRDLRQIPERFASDVAEMAFLAVASIRRGTLVL